MPIARTLENTNTIHQEIKLFLTNMTKVEILLSLTNMILQEIMVPLTNMIPQVTHLFDSNMILLEINDNYLNIYPKFKLRTNFKSIF